MKKRIAGVLLAVCVLVPVSGAARDHYTFDSHETVTRTMKASRVLEVDDFNGSVEVVGDGGSNIRVEGEKIIRAASQEELNRAKREVTLDVNEKDGVTQLYVNGPFRDRDRRDADYHGFHEHSDREYEVTYNFTIHVPNRTEINLRTVSGALKASDINGKFEFHNVNGGITADRLAGSGTVRTVNGSVAVSFRENPKAASEFRSVNGKVAVTFQPGLAADLEYRTLNGAVYTDFEVSSVGAPPAPEAREGRYIYRRNRGGTVRAGAGGPALSFETVNGDIQIRKQGS